MNARKIILAALLLAMIVLTLGSTGCNAWRGLGKDLGIAGDKIQDQ